jgi:hypothetical protein
MRTSTVVCITYFFHGGIVIDAAIWFVFDLVNIEVMISDDEVIIYLSHI